MSSAITISFNVVLRAIYFLLVVYERRWVMCLGLFGTAWMVNNTLPMADVAHQEVHQEVHQDAPENTLEKLRHQVTRQADDFAGMLVVKRSVALGDPRHLANDEQTLTLKVENYSPTALAYPVVVLCDVSRGENHFHITGISFDYIRNAKTFLPVLTKIDGYPGVGEFTYVLTRPDELLLNSDVITGCSVYTTFNGLRFANPNLVIDRYGRVVNDEPVYHYSRDGYKTSLPSLAQLGIAE